MDVARQILGYLKGTPSYVMGSCCILIVTYKYVPTMMQTWVRPH